MRAPLEGPKQSGRAPGRILRLLLLFSSMICCACQTVQPIAVSMGLSAAPNPFDTQKAAGAYETYYDIFRDVPLPRDMKVDAAKTRRPGKADPPDTGFLMLTGNVEQNSLLTAQALTLAKDGWTVIAFYRAPHSMLAAEKGDRVCVVSLGESLTVTYMMIWVTPRSNGFRAPLSRYSTPEATPQEGAQEPVNTAPASPAPTQGEIGESELSS